jgi:predicted nucleotidyltransferase
MLFNETVKWRILVKYFENPEAEYFVKELSRELSISPGSVSRLCKELESEGILKAEEKGRALFYSLRNQEPHVMRLKSAWFLHSFIKSRKSWENEEFQSVALYGSRASGEYVSGSDIDLLVITNANSEELLRSLRKKYKEKLSVTAIPLSKWMKMAKSKDRFYVEVISSHVLLHGPPLVVG